MPPDHRVAIGVSAVIEHQGHRLMLQRGGKEWYADGRGTWAHPGGWLDFGETPDEAAVRETFEETGVLVSALDRQGMTVNFNTDGTLWIVTIFVACRYVHGEPRVAEPQKCPVVEWVPLDDIDRRELFTPVRIYQEKMAAVRAA